MIYKIVCSALLEFIFNSFYDHKDPSTQNQVIADSIFYEVPKQTRLERRNKTYQIITMNYKIESYYNFIYINMFLNIFRLTKGKIVLLIHKKNHQSQALYSVDHIHNTIKKRKIFLLFRLK